MDAPGAPGGRRWGARHRPPWCSCCRRAADEVEPLVAGPEGVSICEGCVAACQRTIAEWRRRGHAGRGEDHLLAQHPTGRC